MRILLVEDEKHIAEAVKQVLQKNNYNVDLAVDSEYGLDCALSGIYDVIVLDIMLPKKDGISVLHELRAKGIDAPVLLWTAKDGTENKVLGLAIAQATARRMGGSILAANGEEGLIIFTFRFPLKH